MRLKLRILLKYSPLGEFRWYLQKKGWLLWRDTNTFGYAVKGEAVAALKSMVKDLSDTDNLSYDSAKPAPRHVAKHDNSVGNLSLPENCHAIWSYPERPSPPAPPPPAPPRNVR